MRRNEMGVAGQATTSRYYLIAALLGNCFSEFMGAELCTKLPNDSLESEAPAATYDYSMNLPEYLERLACGGRRTSEKIVLRTK